MKFTTEIEVRFADLDAYGHVNNAVFFTYLETARVKLFQEGFADHMRSGLLFLVAEASCRYLKPIDLYDRLVIETRSEQLGRSSFTLAYRLHDGGEKTFAEARTVMVCYDQQAGKSVPIPETLRAALS